MLSKSGSSFNFDPFLWDYIGRVSCGMTVMTKTRGKVHSCGKYDGENIGKNNIGINMPSNSVIHTIKSCSSYHQSLEITAFLKFDKPKLYK